MRYPISCLGPRHASVDLEYGAADTIHSGLHAAKDIDSLEIALKVVGQQQPKHCNCGSVTVVEVPPYPEREAPVDRPDA